MKKRIITAFLALTMIFSVVGCTSKSANKTADKSSVEEDSNEGISVDLVSLGEWADVYESNGEPIQFRITNVIWDDEAGKKLVDEYNADATIVGINDLAEKFSDIGYYIVEYEIKYPADYEEFNEKTGIYYRTPILDAEKDESGWYTKDNTSIISIDSTYDATEVPEKIMPGDTVKGQAFGAMIEQYKDVFYIELRYKDPADGKDGDSKKMYFSVK